jgi:hypothetical protein
MEGTGTQVMDIGIRQLAPIIATVHTTQIAGEGSNQDIRSDVLVSVVTGWQEDLDEPEGKFTIQAPVTMLTTF